MELWLEIGKTFGIPTVCFLALCCLVWKCCKYFVDNIGTKLADRHIKFIDGIEGRLDKHSEAMAEISDTQKETAIIFKQINENTVAVAKQLAETTLAVAERLAIHTSEIDTRHANLIEEIKQSQSKICKFRARDVVPRERA